MLFRSNDEYSIITPKDIPHLIEEGSRMNHCVGSYIDRIISGNSKILFLRRTEDINTPLSTIELNKRNKVIQHRGAFNRQPKADEKDIVKYWERKII